MISAQVGVGFEQGVMKGVCPLHGERTRGLAPLRERSLKLRT